MSLYGKVSTIVVTDDTLRNGKIVDRRNRYEVRVRVSSAQEELTEFLKFRDETKELKEAEFRVERTKLGDELGYWDIIKCWETSNN